MFTCEIVRPSPNSFVIVCLWCNMILRNLAVSNFIYITTTVWHFNSHPSMICPLLENVLTCFDMNRKFLRVGRQSSAESREFEKWNQAAAPGGGQGPDPLLKCCDEQMCGLRNEYEPGTDSARGQPVIKFIWFVTIITFVCRVHPKFAQPRQCHLSSYSGGRTLHCIAKMCYWLKFSFRTLFSYSLSL